MTFCGCKRFFQGAEKMVKKILLAVALTIVTFSFISCQTVQGLGRDITWTGEAGANLLGGP
jgi:predicted small secreted protein